MAPETAMEAPGVMMGTFNLNSISATVLFDSGASHSFISQAFVRNHSIPLIAMKNQMLVNSPRGSMPASYCCPSVSLTLRGVDFTVCPIVLRTFGIDVILGMDWMNEHRAVIQCHERVVVLSTPKGDRISIEVAVQPPPTAIVNQMSDANPQDRVVEEFPDVFSDDLPGMPPDRDIEFITWHCTYS